MDTHTQKDERSQRGPTNLPSPDRVPSQHDWRELAQLIQKETDPQKMVELVQLLIARFDEETARKSLQARSDLQR
jgi:hypothetical protein